MIFLATFTGVSLWIFAALYALFRFTAYCEGRKW